MVVWSTKEYVMSYNSTNDRVFLEPSNISEMNKSSPSSVLAVEKVYWALLMIPLPLVAVVGNILVILSVYKEKTLQTATNYFIVSLAFADLLVAAVVMPFAVYVLVNVDWELSETLCDFYIALDVTCSTASIFNLVAISIDRFIAVTQPIKYSKHKNTKRVFLSIAVVWLVSAAIGSPIVLGLNTSPERIPNLCVFYNSDFIIYSSLSSFYIPCIVMVYLYYKIFRAIHERAKKAIGQKIALKKSKKASKQLNAENIPTVGVEECEAHLPVEETKSLSPRQSILSKTKEINHFKSTENITDSTLNHLLKTTGTTAQNDICKSRSLQDMNTKQKFAEELTHTKLSLFQTEVSTKTADTLLSSSAEVSLKTNGAASSITASFLNPKNVPIEFEETSGRVDEETETVVKQKKKPKFTFVKQRKSSKKREKNAAKRERKATKTLAIVLGVFLMCWVPFFTCNILDAICIKLQSDQCRPGVTAFLLTTWLGYINSCINPVIYTIFNMEFRKAFKKLLVGPCIK